MHPVLCPVLWIAPAVLAASCSLLFDEKPGVSADPCSYPLEETLSFYPVEEVIDTLIDVHGLANGQPYLGRDLSTPTGVRAIDGPCGNALSFDAESTAEQWFVAIDSSGHQDFPLSVDLWVKLAPEVEGDRASILTRDQNSNNAADFTMSQIQDGDDARILIRTQSDSLDQYTCSGVLDRESWHHIAVSIGDGMDVRLFVDGVRVAQMGHTLIQNNQTIVCEDSSFESGVNMGENQWPWIVGASNGGSTPTNSRIDDFFTGGAIDNLRIRNAVFTQEEATAIVAPQGA